MIQFKRLLNSPTLMTLGNLVVKSSSLVILLPIILTSFSEAEITFWYSCATIISLQLLLDFGLNPTFTRYVAYGVGGASVNELLNDNIKYANQGNVNVRTIETISYISKIFYSRLSLISVLFIGFLGTWLIYEKLLISGNFTASVITWLFVILTAGISLCGNIFCVVLQGYGSIAVVQRTQMLCALGAIFTSALIALMTHNIFLTVVSFYSWNYLYLFIYRKKFKQLGVNSSKGIHLGSEVDDFTLFILSKCWKSGVGVLASLGVIQLSALVVVKMFSPTISSMYMITLQMIRAISSFSQAPFYSQLPKWAKQYVSKDERRTLPKDINSRVLVSLLVFVGLFVIVSLAFPLLFVIIDSKVEFPNSEFWLLVGAAFLLERFCSMMLQIYTLTGDVIWHKVNLTTSAIMILFSFILVPIFGVSGLPFSMFLAYLLYYLPVICRKTISSMPSVNFKLFLLIIFSSIGVIYVGQS